MKKETKLYIIPHPFQRRVKKLGITLTDLREALQGCWEETEISMMLMGAEQMPFKVETAIEEYLDFIEGPREYDEITNEVSNILMGEIS